MPHKDGSRTDLPVDAKTGHAIEILSHQDEDVENSSGTSTDLTFEMELRPGRIYEVSCVAQAITDNGLVYLLPSDVSPAIGYRWVWGLNPTFQFKANQTHQSLRVTCSVARTWSLRELR